MNRYFIKTGDGIFDSVFDGFYDLDELRKEHPEIYNKYMFDFTILESITILLFLMIMSI